MREKWGKRESEKAAEKQRGGEDLERTRAMAEIERLETERGFERKRSGEAEIESTRENMETVQGGLSE